MLHGFVQGWVEARLRMRRCNSHWTPTMDEASGEVVIRCADGYELRQSEMSEHVKHLLFGRP